jgi:solute carrier family 25, member 33/36
MAWLEGVRRLYHGLSVSILGIGETAMQWVLYEEVKWRMAVRKWRMAAALADKGVGHAQVEAGGGAGAV